MSQPGKFHVHPPITALRFLPLSPRVLFQVLPNVTDRTAEDGTACGGSVRTAVDDLDF